MFTSILQTWRISRDHTLYSDWDTENGVKGRHAGPRIIGVDIRRTLHCLAMVHILAPTIIFIYD